METGKSHHRFGVKGTMPANAKIGDGLPPAEGARWRIARRGWYVCTAVALAILLLAIPGYLVRRPMGSLSNHLVYEPTPLMVALNSVTLTVSFTVALLSLGLATVLYRKRPRDPMALYLAYYLLVHGVLLAGPIEMMEYRWPGTAAINSFLLLPVLFVPLSMGLLALFPDGRFVPGWTRWAVVASLSVGPIAYPLANAGLARGDDPVVGALTWVAYGWVFGLGAALVYGQRIRYRRHASAVQRQQTKWVLYGFTVMFGLMAASHVPWQFALTLPRGTTMPWWVPLAEMVWTASVAVLPITLTMAVTRYRLYDLDLIINRTLVYGTLTVSVIAIYVLVVGSVGALLRTEGNILLSLGATGLVAVLFHPMRNRLQHAVDRFFYGQRDDPLETLSQLARRLEAAIDPEVVLPTLVETIAQTLKLPYVAISLRTGDGFKVAACVGEEVTDALRLSLIYQGETVGQLIAGQRGPGESFSRADKRLLAQIARQAGPAVRAVQLTAALQRSRQQLVTAREEERRRLRRDLHDGLGATLAALHLEAGGLRRAIRNDPERAETLVNEFRADIRATIGEIRRLVYDLRPPTLDQLGLVAAVRAQAAACSRVERPEDGTLRIRVEAPETLPPLPAAVEVAAYRIAQEALTNVVHHARARHCKVQLAMTAAGLLLKVEDDGVGLADNQPDDGGVGLLSMRERAAELGGTCVIEEAPDGGTRVATLLPLPQR